MDQYDDQLIALTAEQVLGASLSYSLDCSALTGNGIDPIQTSNWTCSDTSITLSNPVIYNSTTQVTISGGTGGTWYQILNTVTTLSGATDVFVVMVYIKPAVTMPVMGSALFPSRFSAVAKLRRDRLVLAAASVLPSVDMRDDYIWEKIVAAESEIGHALRVPMAPTTFFPDTPTSAQIAAITTATWAIDPGYDYEPDSFSYNDKWGMLKLRNKPIQSVSSAVFAYPGGAGSSYNLPIDWLRMDKKNGTIQFVPSTTAYIAPLTAFMMQALGTGRTVPLAIQFTYVAGLASPATDYPELLDVVMKKAVLKILEDSFLPQSGSISADGLSQSLSVDMEKYHDMIDRTLNGGKGSNGGLMTAIHGVRIGVLG